MIPFHDRRKSAPDFENVAAKIELPKGSTIGERAINNRFLVVGVPAHGRRDYQIHEVLPSGTTTVRETGYGYRNQAKRQAAVLNPTQIIDL